MCLTDQGGIIEEEDNVIDKVVDHKDTNNGPLYLIKWRVCACISSSLTTLLGQIPHA